MPKNQRLQAEVAKKAALRADAAVGDQSIQRDRNVLYYHEVAGTGSADTKIDGTVTDYDEIPGFLKRELVSPAVSAGDDDVKLR